MPRLGVPSTTDSARVITDVCGEPAPLPRSINPRHNDRPGGTFPRVVQPLIETWEKGRKEGAWGPPRGRKPRVQAAAQWRRFDVPRATSKRASSAFTPTLTPADYARQAIDFSKLPGRTGRPDEHSGCLVGSVGNPRTSPRRKDGCRDWAHLGRNPQDMRGR
jgi:hypothetical protein